MFLQGLILGFSIAAQVGPIGVLCIRRTLADGRLTFLSGLGAATADMAYEAVGIIREKFTPVWMQWVNRISGAIIIAFFTLANLIKP